MDISRALYLCVSVVSLYLIVMFLTWWIRAGSASAIFAITTVLWMGIFFNYFGMWWMNFNLMAGDAQGAFVFYRQWWWPWRHLTILVPLVWYAIHVTNVCWSSRMHKQNRRFSDLTSGTKKQRRRADD